MIKDANLEFAVEDGLVMVVATPTVVGDVVDLGDESTLHDIGTGEPLNCVMQVGDVAVAASSGAANITFELVSDSTSDLATSPTVHFSTGAIAKGTLVAGYEIASFSLPKGAKYERYLGVRATADTHGITAGTLNAFLVKDSPSYTAYPDGI